MIAASEVKPGSQMNEHVLKHMTGGESLRAEYKFGRSFTIRPVGKIWLGVNHRPHVVDDSYGFWRRLRLIPFLQTFAGSSDDRSLKQALQKEASGILAWAVRGCLAWQAEGLDPPEIVRAATERYQQGEDVLADFVESRLDVVPDMRTSLLRVYEAYRDWAVTQGIPERSKLSAKQLDDLMQTRPIVRVKEGGNVYYQDLAVVRSRLFDGDAS
jgi:putative DNA primase/helicase